MKYKLLNQNFLDLQIIGFDLDQTLYPKSPEIDTAIQTYLYQEISKFRNIDPEEAKKLFDNIYQAGEGLSGSQTMIELGFSVDKARNMVQEALENAPIAKFLQPNNEVIDLLYKLKSKYRSIDLITGSNKKNASVKLKKIEIPEEIFSKIITKDDGSKADLSAFHLWLSFYPDLKQENFIYIGDRVSSDYEKPKELGIQSILVNTKNKDLCVECLQLNNLLNIRKYLL